MVTVGGRRSSKSASLEPPEGTFEIRVGEGKLNAGPGTESPIVARTGRAVWDTFPLNVREPRPSTRCYPPRSTQMR